MTTSVKLHGTNQIGLAAEFARIAGGETVLDGSVLRFDAGDAGELEAIAKDAIKFWKGLGKRSMADAANTLREKFAEIRATESYALTFTK